MSATVKTPSWLLSIPSKTECSVLSLTSGRGAAFATPLRGEPPPSVIPASSDQLAVVRRTGSHPWNTSMAQSPAECSNYMFDSSNTAKLAVLGLLGRSFPSHPSGPVRPAPEPLPLSVFSAETHRGLAVWTAVVTTAGLAGGVGTAIGICKPESMRVREQRL